MRRLALLLALLMSLPPAAATAHEARPAYLELVEAKAGDWHLTWKQPVMGDRAVMIAPELSNGWLEAEPTEEHLASTHYIRRWRIAAPASELEGARLSVTGLDRGLMDVLVHLRTADGEGSDTILRRSSPSMTVEFSGHGSLAVPAYLGLGIHHILVGIDHLLFLLGLLLLVGGGWRLVGAITAFTLAHSITLAAAALGLVAVPVAVIEALVALSIVFVAYELARAGRLADSLTARKPWLIAFTFGLLHGFAFAGALAETGLPEDAIPMSLFLFNAGVEIGQLLFVGVVLLAVLVWRRLAGVRLPRIEGLVAGKLAPYAMGCYASFLFFERTGAAFA